jgi:hypothetical protein
MPFVVRYLLAKNKRTAFLAHLDNGLIGFRPREQADVLATKEDAEFFIRTALLGTDYSRTDYSTEREAFEVEYVFVPKAPPKPAQTLWDHLLDDDSYA